MSLSPNCQAILLLTAPLIVGRVESNAELLTLGEYKRLAKFLHESKREPADLLASDLNELLAGFTEPIDAGRIRNLLGRGFLLSQAVEHWQARSIWVVSRADGAYPARIKSRLRENAPAVLYGCGERALLDNGGLAVVGSRNVEDSLVKYTEEVGRLAARASISVVSGCARGIDQAAMRGALEEEGRVAGVLADSLERMALGRENREFLVYQKLVLISPYDPSAGFNVGNAMARNKLIYALSDVGLVVSSDFNKGGTWAGAVEQLDKLRFVPIYVRAGSDCDPGLDGLRKKGAVPWPEPESPEALLKILASIPPPEKIETQQNELFSAAALQGACERELEFIADPDSSLEASFTSQEEMFEKLRELLTDTEKNEAEVIQFLRVSKPQAKEILKSMVASGELKKLSKPVRYTYVGQPTLFSKWDTA